ncbi:hypothetical protein [Jannaschia donghaensis]|uniref:Uncharacterized protein n=1 Tax=Jannaschia donghaensis TaxID=420998 RepID=A0A0M6YNU1_9RHOB|nr:hypothetical protein [Jannaschia donghaensis]CTQ50917.1 hypothetical protein JDO7802_02948 [Jannaschia donghaensis]
MEENTMGHEGLDTPRTTIERLEAALESMEALRRAAERKVIEFNGLTDEEIKAADLSQIQRELGKAVQSVVVEEGKASDAIRQQNSGGGIDFDAARASIRGRLDRIRTADGA